MNAVDILVAARDIIANGRWKQGSFCGYTLREDGEVDWEKGPCYCAVGALNEAAEKPVGVAPTATSSPKYPHGRAAFFLANAITGRSGDVADVIAFNDRPGRTREEVVKAFDVAISNCRRRKVTNKVLRTAR